VCSNFQSAIHINQIKLYYEMWQTHTKHWEFSENDSAEKHKKHVNTKYIYCYFSVLAYVNVSENGVVGTRLVGLLSAGLSHSRTTNTGFERVWLYSITCTGGLRLLRVRDLLLIYSFAFNSHFHYLYFSSLLQDFRLILMIHNLYIYVWWII